MINKEDIFIGQLVDFETILYRVVEIKENSAIVKPIYHDWKPEEAQFSELYPVSEEERDLYKPKEK
jgi:hypothetical protein